MIFSLIIPFNYKPLINGRLPDDWQEQIAKLRQNKADTDETQQPSVADMNDDDIPPHQLGFWNEEE